MIGHCADWLPRLASRARLAQAQQTPVKRGKYLVNTIMTCGNCHSPKGARGAPICGQGFLRRAVLGRAAVQGDRAQHHAGQGDRHRQMDRRRDQDSAAQRQRPNGVQLAMVMPTGLLRDHDRARHRRDRRLSAHDQADQATRCRIRSTRCRRSHTSSRAPRSRTPKPMMNDKVKKGFYLATIGHCMECHTPMGRAAASSRPARRGRLRIPRALGRVGVAQHHVEQEEGHRRLDRRRDQARDHHGHEQGRQQLKPPMGFHYYANMTDGDLDAVVAYLRTRAGEGVAALPRARRNNRPSFGPGGRLYLGSDSGQFAMRMSLF